MKVSHVIVKPDIIGFPWKYFVTWQTLSSFKLLIFDERILIRKLFLRIQVGLKIIPRLFDFILINLQTYSMFLKCPNTHSQ